LYPPYLLTVRCCPEVQTLLLPSNHLSFIFRVLSHRLFPSSSNPAPAFGAPKPTTSFFGTAPQQQQPSTSIFGATANQPQQSNSLFGAGFGAQNQQQQQPQQSAFGSSFFANSNTANSNQQGTQQPQQQGAFGGFQTNTNQQPQQQQNAWGTGSTAANPLQQQATQPAGSSFFSNPNANTGPLFGAQPKPPQSCAHLRSLGLDYCLIFPIANHCRLLGPLLPRAWEQVVNCDFHSELRRNSNSSSSSLFSPKPQSSMIYRII
jgi:hypothetical protein